MTSAGSVYVPTPVRRKAEATGAAGIHWLRDLSMVVADLEEEWQIEVGETIPGGSGGFVAAASTADGVRVVLKIAIPDGLEGQGDFAREVATLQYGNPASYVRLVRVDHSVRAVLLERLGRPLSELGWSVESQIDVIAETLRRSWKRIAPGVVDRTGAQQAEFLAKFIDRQWFELGEPCARHDRRRAPSAGESARSLRPANRGADPRRCPSGERPGGPARSRSGASLQADRSRRHDLRAGPRPRDPAA